MRRRPSRPPDRPLHPHSRRLRLEPLEDRRVLATYVVDSLEDNTLDDGKTTLREVIALANADPGGDVIEFAAELSEEGPRTLTLEERLAGMAAYAHGRASSVRVAVWLSKAA